MISVEKDSDSGLRIEYASRYEAELAMKDGAGYGGSMLSIDFVDSEEKAKVEEDKDGAET